MDDGAAADQAPSEMAPTSATNVVSFAYLELKGTRFDPPGMPLGAMQEMSHFRDAVMAVARENWLEAHPGRTYAPRGFAEGLDLRFIRVDDGSAKPILYLHSPAGSGSTDDESWDPFFRDAVGSIADTVARVNTEGAVPSADLSPDVERRIRRLGSSLDDGESLTLGDTSSKSRRSEIIKTTVAILQRIDSALSGPSAIDLVGFIVEFDSVERSFRLITATGSSVCYISASTPGLARSVKEYLAPDGITAPDVLVRGMSENGSSKSPTLTSVFDVSVRRNVEQKALVMEVRSLGLLTAGSLATGSLTPTSLQVGRAVQVAEVFLELQIAAHAVPTVAGGIAFEWTVGDTELTACVDADNKMFLCADNTETDELDSLEATYDSERLVAFVRRGALSA